MLSYFYICKIDDDFAKVNLEDYEIANGMSSLWIDIHDASWRYSFGGEIYKRRGSHGCINAPIYLAEIIFDNIEEGTPIICYKK